MTKNEKLSKIDNELTVAIAAEKVTRAKAEADYYANVRDLQRGAQEMREAVYNEPEEPQDGDQPTVWLNGEQWTAAVVARRILKKLPSIPYNCSIDISFLHYTENGINLQLKAYNPNRKGNCFESLWMYEHDEPEKQAADISDWMERVDKLLSYKPTNDHVEEPIGSALDAMFGGNPLDDFPTLRKEAENE